MKTNMGVADRVVRILLVVLIAVLYFTNVISGTLAIILGIVAVIFLITSITGFCGLYKVLGIKTCAVKSNK